MVEIFCDGAVRDDGKYTYGASACAIAVFNKQKPIYSASRLLTCKTSNQAEYEAIILALTTAVAADWFHPIIYTDSKTAYNQITGIWVTKSLNLVPLLYTIKQIQQRRN